MTETEYLKLVAQAFQKIMDVLEHADSAGDIDVEESAEVISIELENGKQFIVNRHIPTRQIWLSSPKSGAHHFVYDSVSEKWKTATNELIETIKTDIRELADIVI